MSIVLKEIKDRVGYIILNRPEKRNSFSFELIKELKEILDEFESNHSVKTIILKANGEVFSAGADLAYLQQLQNNTFEENIADSSHLKELYEKIYKHPKVIIAQVEGAAIAGGCGLASICDFTFATPTAKFGYTEVKIGFIPAIVLVFLQRKIGEGKARELLLTGDLVDANYAERIGLINKVIDADQMEAYCYQFAQQLNMNASASSLALTKKMLAEVPEKTLSEALNYAASMNAKARATDDCKRGIQAFLNKEKISF